MNINNFKAVLFDLDHTLVTYPKPGGKSFLKTSLTTLVGPAIPANEIEKGTTGSREKRTREREKSLKKYDINSETILGAVENERADENNTNLITKIKKLAENNQTLLAFETFNKLTEHNYKQKMIEENKMNNVPYAEELLEKIKEKNKKMAIVTVTPEQTAKMQLEKTGLDPTYFEFIIGCDQNILERKPSPKPILRACKKLNIAPKETIMVGDSETDVTSANIAGAYSIQVMGKIGQQKPKEYYPNLKELIQEI